MIGRRVAAGLLVSLVFGAGSPWPASGQGAVAPALWEAAGVTPAARRVLAPRFALKDPGGRSLDIGGASGRVVMLYFWTTW